MEREDEDLLSCLQKIEDCMEKRMNLLKRMRKGYFKLGKAKSAGRFGQISESRLPSELNATTRIVVTPSGSFELVRGPSHTFKEEEKIGFKKESNMSGLRRRGVSKKVNIDQNKMKDSRRATEKDVDPIHWFGLVSPDSLRNAQKDFIKALNKAIEIANINREIDARSEVFSCLK